MKTRASREQLWHLIDFLGKCQNAASPPLISPYRSNSLAAAALGLVHPDTLEGIFGAGLPIEGSEPLSSDRASRIAIFERCLKAMPGFSLIRAQPEVIAALDSFERIRRRRKNELKFCDDLAMFRFWYSAAWANYLLDRRHVPEPDAKQRLRASNAAKVLLQLISKTRALELAGLQWESRKQFCEELAKLVALTGVLHRPRQDAYTADREYVSILTDVVWYQFGDCPPTLIYHLAGLKVRSPDKAAIASQVSERKQALAKRVNQ